MIHAFALEPRLVASWGRRGEFRYFHDKFGLGTPRVMLEMPAFNKWKKAVYNAAHELALSQEDMKRIEELFRIFSEHRCRRTSAVYDGIITWLENAEAEHERSSFRGIIASENPRHHRAVLAPEHVSAGNSRWSCERGASPSRTPKAIADALSDMIINSKMLHLIDPHFGPENLRHRKVLTALMEILASHMVTPEVVKVHCSAKSDVAFFGKEAAKLADYLPSGCTIEFIRWRQKPGGEKLHNRYVLSDIGGIALGVGLDEGEAGETDDLLLLPREQYARRWKQYVENDGAFTLADTPPPIQGKRPIR